MTDKYSIKDEPVYPHIKLTVEPFPRALATRIIRDDGDEYFGAFLNRTSVRILIDFLNRTFRLRSCAIEIDGTFPVPCTQYYAKRCVAPCVASLCDRESYLEMVDLVRLFLRDHRELLLSAIGRHIQRASDSLDFETAAFYRDILHNVESYWSQGRYQIWLDDTVDTFELYADDEAVYVIVISQRGRRTLGERVYAFAALDRPTRVLRDVIDSFYQFHLPREIRVSHDFEDRADTAKRLSERFAKKIAITVAGESNRRITAERAVEMTKARLDLERRKKRPTTATLMKELQSAFDLKRKPKRIEAFDVAHISATGFAAAVSVWQEGDDLPDEYEHWLSDRTGELETLRAFVTERTSRSSPDLIVIDGGAAHLKAAIESVAGTQSPPDVVAAVKPRGKHMSISHFLTPDKRIEFDQDDHAHRLLQRLRDDAHDLANAAHRLSRDMKHFYELAAILPSLNERERQALFREFGSIRKIVELDDRDLTTRFGKRAVDDIARYRRGESAEPRPLIVPIRFVETEGAAEDLIPIDSR